MAAEGGRKSAPLSEHLFREAYRFDFFQAVRLLEHLARPRAGQDASRARFPVGGDWPPRREVVRFRALPSLSFPAGSIARIRPAAADDDPEAGPPEMMVTFMGLAGPSGVLPLEYTTLVIERSHVKNKDRTLGDFFDLFNHRAVSLFFRAWEKYRFPFAYERWRLNAAAGEEDLFTFVLLSLVGLGTAGLRRRLAVDDESVLFYGGHFAHWPRSAVSLECLLADYFEAAVGVEQFRGQWLYLRPLDQSCLPGARHPDGLHVALGENVIVGQRVWDVQGKFRVRLGPLGYRQFCRFMPQGDGLVPLAHLVRLYVGPEFDFDVQPVLSAAEVPWCRLGGDGPGAPRLGWNTWLRGGDFERDAQDAVFSLDGV